MKAIIIAAGKGSRLNPLTDDRPKCMLELSKKTLLEHQIEALKTAGIDRIAVIKGYKKERITYPGLIYYINDDYQKNDILHSLFYAGSEMNDAFIAVYSDILYDAAVVKRLLDHKGDISIVVDVEWRRSYEGRTEHTIEEAENVVFDADNNLLKIGKALSDMKSVNGEFIGMMKCEAKGALIFKRHFNSLKKIYSGKPFQTAPVFEKAYLTDMLQDMVDHGIPVTCVTVNGGWREVDTVEDYRNLQKGSLI